MGNTPEGYGSFRLWITLWTTDPISFHFIGRWVGRPGVFTRKAPEFSWAGVPGDFSRRDSRTRAARGFRNYTHVIF